MTSIYVASSWRNTFQPAVVDLLREAGHDVYDFRNPPLRTGFSWREVDPDWERWNVPRYREGLATPAAQAGFASDLAGMERSRVCVLVLPCGRSAHLEAGWFTGRRRPLVVYIPPCIAIEPELMYLLANTDPRQVIAATPHEVLELVRRAEDAPATHEERLAMLIERAMEAHDAVAAAVGMGGGPPLYRERLHLELERHLSIAAEHWKIDLTQVPNLDVERTRADEAEQRASAAEARAHAAEAGLRRDA